MIALFAALQLEVQPFLRRLRVRSPSGLSGFPVILGEYHGLPVLVCRTGLGQRAGEGASTVLGRYRPEGVLSVGLAGALSPECRVGDLVFCQRVHCLEADGRLSAPLLSDERFLEAARRAAHSRGLSSRTGGSLTASRLVAEPQEKAALRHSTGLDVAEMESYWVGRAALERGIPFLALRAVSDGAGDALPDIPGVVTPEGELRIASALAYALGHPTRLPLLLRTGGRAREAVSSLTRFLEAFVSAFETAPLGRPA